SQAPLARLGSRRRRAPGALPGPRGSPEGCCARGPADRAALPPVRRGSQGLRWAGNVVRAASPEAWSEAHLPLRKPCLATVQPAPRGGNEPLAARLGRGSTGAAARLGRGSVHKGSFGTPCFFCPTTDDRCVG